MSVWEYVYLAVGTGIFGAIVTFVLVLVCGYLGINMIENLWLLAMPLVLSLLVNVLAIEIYRRHKGK
jgi:hypothetical protein